MDRFQGMTVQQLREFLNSRGVPNVGKRRQELEKSKVIVLRTNAAVDVMTHLLTPGNGASMSIGESDFHIP